MTRLKKVLKKIVLVILVLIMIYFCIGLLAALVMIIIEATTHKMSLEIQLESPTFQPWIIYIGMAVMIIFCAGIALGAFFAHRAIRKIGKPKQFQKKETEVY